MEITDPVEGLDAYVQIRHLTMSGRDIQVLLQDPCTDMATGRVKLSHQPTVGDLGSAVPTVGTTYWPIFRSSITGVIGSRGSWHLPRAEQGYRLIFPWSRADFSIVMVIICTLSTRVFVSPRHLKIFSENYSIGNFTDFAAIMFVNDGHLQSKKSICRNRATIGKHGKIGRWPVIMEKLAGNW